MSIVHVMCVCYQLFDSIWSIQSKPTGKQSIKSSDYHYLYWTGIWQCLKPHAESPSLRFCGYGSTPFIFLVRSAVAILHTRVRIGFDLVAIGSLHWMMTNPTGVLLWPGRWEPAASMELAYQSSVLKLFTMFKTKVRWDGTCVSISFFSRPARAATQVTVPGWHPWQQSRTFAYRSCWWVRKFAQTERFADGGRWRHLCLWRNSLWMFLLQREVYLFEWPGNTTNTGYP